jgi:hypothetical protein
MFDIDFNVGDMGRRAKEGGAGTTKGGGGHTHPRHGRSTSHWVRRSKWVCVVMIRLFYVYPTYVVLSLIVM